MANQLRQRFFKPLGLDDTVYQPMQRPDADAAHGHWGTGGSFADTDLEAQNEEVDGDSDQEEDDGMGSADIS